MDRLVAVPGYESSESIPLTCIKNSMFEDGLVAVNVNNMTAHSVLRSPRELGWFAFDLASITTATLASYNNWRVRQYVNFEMMSGPAQNLTSSAARIDRAANFTQKWLQYTAGDEKSELYNVSICESITPAAQQFMTTGYKTAAGVETLLSSTVNADWSYDYFRIQYLPFILNPFDTAYYIKHADEDQTDVWRIAHTFSLCGFLASDYREDQLNRATQVINQGYMYVQDPFVADSIIFK